MEVNDGRSVVGHIGSGDPFPFVNAKSLIVHVIFKLAARTSVETRVENSFDEVMLLSIDDLGLGRRWILKASFDRIVCITL